MEIKDDYHYLVHLVKCGLFDLTPNPIPQEVDMEKVFEYAKLHEVGNIAYLGLEKLSTKPKNYNSFVNFYYNAIQRDILQSQILQKVLFLLHENKIRTILAQGTEIKKLYPSSDLRMMSDIDIIIDKENLNKCKEMLLQNDFILTDENDQELTFSLDTIVIEIHSDFFLQKRTFKNGVNCSSVLSGAFIDGIKIGEYSYKLTNERLFLFTLLHFLKHFLSSGAGIRRVVDLFYIKQKLYKDCDNEHIDRLLAQNGLKNYAQKCFELSEYWFGEYKPIEDFSGLEKTIFYSGNHGSVDVIAHRNLADIKTQGGKLNKTKYVCKRIFIDKKTAYEIYPFCKKHHYPLFLCWLHRINCLLFCKKTRKKAKNEIKKIK